MKDQSVTAGKTLRTWRKDEKVCFPDLNIVSTLTCGSPFFLKCFRLENQKFCFFSIRIIEMFWNKRPGSSEWPGVGVLTERSSGSLWITSAWRRTLRPAASTGTWVGRQRSSGQTRRPPSSSCPRLLDRRGTSRLTLPCPKVKGQAPETVRDITTQNAYRLFSRASRWSE